MLCSSKMMRHSVIFPLGHSYQSQYSMIRSCIDTIAPVTTNLSEKKCRRTGLYKFRFEDRMEERSSLLEPLVGPRSHWCIPLICLPSLRPRPPPGELFFHRTEPVKAVQVVEVWSESREP